MTADEILADIERLRERAADAELARSMEMSLYRSVLAHIMMDASGASDMARLALKSENIAFDRWPS